MVRYGINAGNSELRNGTNPARAAAWAQTIRDLGVEVVRTGVYRVDDALSQWWPNSAPPDPALNDLGHVLRAMEENPDLRFSLVLQDPGGFRFVPGFRDATGTDLRRRRAFFTEYGYALGRGIADAGFGERVAFFELGNEPDLAAILNGAPHSGMQASDYDPEAVERVRTTVSAMKTGLTEAFGDAGAPCPPIAFGVTSIHWGLTDMIWNGTTPSAPDQPSKPPMDWDVTVVHWYSNDSYLGAFGNLLQQDTGFERLPYTWVPRPNPAREFTERYGKPVAITEFGIRNNSPEYSADPEKRATALTRLAAGLTGSATRYDISDLIFFSLTDEPASSEPGVPPEWAGKYGVAEWNPTQQQFDLRSTGVAYRDFVAAPIAARPYALTYPAPKLAIPREAGDEPRTFVFRGKGTPGATIEVLGGANGRLVASGSVDETGEWAAETQPGDAVTLPGEYTVLISQRLQSATHPAREPLNWLVTRRELAVAVPADGSTVGRPSDGQPFVGTGEPAATVHIRGRSGRDIVSGSVPANDSAWSLCSAPDDPVVAPGTYTVLVTQQVREFESAPVEVTWTVR